MEKILYIHEQFFTEHPVLMGYLYVYNNKGKEVYSFEFDNDWLKNHNNVLIDPELAY